jgi:hypothetical protein
MPDADGTFGEPSKLIKKAVMERSTATNLRTSTSAYFTLNHLQTDIDRQGGLAENSEMKEVPQWKVLNARKRVGMHISR